MQCPYCGKDKDRVIDSRSSEGGRVVRRRRECGACQRRYTTYERAEDTVRVTVVKKDDSREPYSRQKIINGLMKACYKRPVTNEQIRAVVESAEEEMFRHFDKEVPSSFIGDVVSRKLSEIDKISYVRFASVYREFADVGDLILDAQELDRTPPVGPDQKNLFESED